jgi:hypothetical protein
MVYLSLVCTGHNDSTDSVAVHRVAINVDDKVWTAYLRPPRQILTQDPEHNTTKGNAAAFVSLAVPNQELLVVHVYIRKGKTAEFACPQAAVKEYEQYKPVT